MNPGDYLIIRHRSDDALALSLMVETITYEADTFGIKYDCVCFNCGGVVDFRLEELRQYVTFREDNHIRNTYEIALSDIDLVAATRILMHSSDCWVSSYEYATTVAKQLGMSNEDTRRAEAIALKHRCTIGNVIEIYKLIASMVYGIDKQRALVDIVCSLFDSGYNLNTIMKSIPTIVKLYENGMFRNNTRAVVVEKPTVRIIRED